MTRLNRTLIWLLQRVGKRYTPDRELPAGLILSTLRRRSVDLLRGLLRLRGRVFVGPRVRLRGKRCLRVEPFATLDRGCDIDGYARDGVQIGRRSKIGAFTVISCTSHLSKLGRGLRVGCDSAIGEFGYLGAAGGITIGDNVIMGQYVSFHSESHNYDDPSQPIRLQGVHSEGIVIEDNVWVGSKVTFLDGSVVGSHTVIAAGAVVRGRFPSHALIGGVPARVIRRLPGSAENGAAEPERISGTE